MKKTKDCSFHGCGLPVRAKGLCATHWSQQRNGKPLVRRFLNQKPPGSPPRVICDEVPCQVPGLVGPCHVYRNCKTKGGYGHILVGDKLLYVHRYVFSQEQTLTPRLLVDHLCRNRACCNPDHLRAVTKRVNNTENVIGSTAQRNAAKTHCIRGHPLSGENMYRQGKNLAGRGCRACKRAKALEYYYKNKTHASEMGKHEPCEKD